MSREFCEYIIDQLSPWAIVTTRPMFGCFGIYRAGKMFGIVADDVLYFKADNSNQTDYEAAGSERFTYEVKNGKKHSLSYWQVPSDIIDDHELIAEWADKAYQTALRAAKAKSEKSKR